MKTKVAVVQESPLFFNKEQTIQKIEKMVQECSGDGCRLVVFPESYIPGYPRGFSFGVKVGKRTEAGRQLYQEYYDQSIDLTGDDLPRLEHIAREHNVYLVLGATERQAGGKTLYCSMLYISPDHGLLGVHRKLKPTAAERVIWGEGNGADLVSFDTPIGKLGGLICWENYMPLARMSMYRQGVEIYMAPTADSRPEWIQTMVHIALEGRCYVIGCNQYITKSMYPEKYQHLVAEEPDHFCEGGSIIISPLGKIIEGPLFGQAGVLSAELDLDQVVQAKMDFDVVGHYSRDDIFELSIKDQPKMKRGP